MGLFALHLRETQKGLKKLVRMNSYPAAHLHEPFPLGFQFPYMEVTVPTLLGCYGRPGKIGRASTPEQD